MNASSPCSIDWIKIVESFENSFKKEFAHFDNLPEQYKVIDGAKLLWCNLLLVDAMIYVLMNDSVNTSCRRAFNQHKILTECIEKAVENAAPEIFALITSEKNIEALRVGRRNYQVVSEPLFQRLTEKFGHTIQHAPLVSPWRSIDDMRLSFANGPTSKAKNKYFVITELLLNHEAFNQFQSNMSTIIQQVAHRAIFKYKSRIPPAILVPVISVAGVETKKQKRTYTISDETLHKRASNFRPSQAPRYAYPLKLDHMDSSVTSVMELATSVPVQLATSLIPLPLISSSHIGDLGNLDPDHEIDLLAGMFEVDTDSSETPAEEKARKAAEKLVKLKREKMLKKVIKTQKKTQPTVPVTIRKNSAEDLCAVIPVLPLNLLEGELSSVSTDSSDGEGMVLFDSDEDFEIYDDDVFATSKDDNDHMANHVFSVKTAYVASGKKVPSPLLEEKSSMTSTDEMEPVSPVSPPSFTMEVPKLQSKLLSNPPSLVITINPATTKYILHDNVLCAIVPVFDPRIRAAAQVVESTYQGDIFGIDTAKIMDFMTAHSQELGQDMEMTIDNNTPTQDQQQQIAIEADQVPSIMSFNSSTS